MARSIIEAPQAALEAAKRYLISSASATFEEAFAIEHDKQPPGDRIRNPMQRVDYPALHCR
jgi:hypothetical protein